MTEKRIVLSRREYEKLWNIIEAMRSSNRLREPYLRHLYDELQAAVVLDEGVLPAGTVTLYAEVAYTNLSTGSRHQASIVFPADQNHDEKRYSIFTPSEQRSSGSRNTTEPSVMPRQGISPYA